MPNYSRKIVYLSEAQKAELFTNHTITVNGTTITYNENDLYVTPQEQPYIKPSNGIPASDLAAGVVNVNDVQINSSSIVSNGTATIPIGSNTTFGVFKRGSGLYDTNGTIGVNTSYENDIKGGTAGTFTNVNRQHYGVFYGLAKAAGHDEKNSTESFGTYTDGAKAAIQNMLGITDLISTEESSTATAAHALNSTFMMNGKLHRATAAIAIGDAVEVGTNCEVVKADEVFVKKTDYLAVNKAGVAKIHNGYGIDTDVAGNIYIVGAGSTAIKNGTGGMNPIVPAHQHESVFYGLSKVAGVDLANETVTLGTYPETSKTAIRSLIGAGTPLDVQVNGTSVVSNGVANISIASNNTFGVSKIDSALGISISGSGSLMINIATPTNIKDGINGYKPIVPVYQHNAVFYGLAKAAGDATQSASSNAVGTYTANAKAAIWQMLGLDGSAFIAQEWELIADVTTTEDLTQYAVTTDLNGNAFELSEMYTRVILSAPTTGATGYIGGSTYLKTYSDLYLWNSLPTINTRLASGNTFIDYIHKNIDGNVLIFAKSGSGFNNTQNLQMASIPYTLANQPMYKTICGIRLEQYNSNHTLIPSGTRIQIYGKRQRAVLDFATINVSGSTPTITALPGHRYICGEVSTLSVTAPASGIIDITFDSGSTATVLTVTPPTGMTMKWAGGFDPTSLEANTTYEINIADGCLGVCGKWT